MAADGKRARLPLALASSFVLFLSGCGSTPEDRVYEAFKCGKVAFLLEQHGAGDRAMMSVKDELMELEQLGGNPSMMAMEMGARFQDDVPLYRLSLQGQMELLADIYQSSDCQNMYATRP